MFAFFRRPNKKSSEKKNTKNRLASKFINEIQCVPVDKFEINFVKNSKKTEESKPEKLLKTISLRSIMGNSESSTKKGSSTNSSEHSSVDANNRPQQSNLNNNVYQKPEVQREQNIELKRENKTEPKSQNKCKTNYPKFYETNSNSEQNRQQSCVNVEVTNNKPNEDKNEFKNTINTRDGKEKEKLNEENKSNVHLKSNISKTAHEEETTSKTRDSNLCSEGIRVMTNGMSYANVKCDKYSKEENNVVQTSHDDIDCQENFGTTPSSPTAKGVINQRNENFVEQSSLSNQSAVKANNIKDDVFQSVPSADYVRSNATTQTVKVRKNFEAETKTPLVEEKHIENTTKKDESEKISEKKFEGNFSTEEKNEVNSIDRACESVHSCDINSNSKTAVSLDENETSKTEEEQFEEAENSADICDTENKKKPIFCINLAENLLQQQNYRSRTNRIQIPDITITESSDSEGENENENEYEMEYFRDNYYDRTFPSTLYDITEVDETFSDASDMDFNLISDDKRNIVHQETKFQEQIKALKCEIETKDNENMQLRGKINDLQRDIMNKTWGMDRLHAELAAFQAEADCVRKKLLNVEDDLNKYKTQNTELNAKLLKTFENEDDLKKAFTLQTEIDKLKEKIIEVQNELENVKKEKSELQVQIMKSETEKNEKIKTLEIALNDTLKQKQKLQIGFEEEYEKLRTVNSDREQQMLNDFEWKLREVELTCKRKLEEKDTNCQEKVKQIKENLENEITQLQHQLKEVEKMKSYEAEVSQLRGLTQEQERSLRMQTRVSDQLHSNERVLNEEIEKLRSSLEKERTNLATVQNIHSREIAEKDRKHSFKLEQQKNELNSQWEDKVRRESIRLKLELEKTYKDEKRNLLDEVKTKSEMQLKQSDQVWEKKMSESKKELESLEQKLAEKGEAYKKELLRLQTNSDRDMLELRRKLDKMDLSYQEQLEKKQEHHEQEIECLREEYEKKLQLSEQNWSQQVSSTRATLELVKEQLQREAEDRLEALSKKYLLQLEQQYERLMNEKEEAVMQLQEQYNSKIYEIQNKLNEELKVQKCRENELLEIISQLKEEIRNKCDDGPSLQENLTSLQHTVSGLREKISNYEILSTEAEVTLQKRDAEHEETIAKMKDCYENEIKYWKSKILASQKETSPTKGKSPELPPKVQECHNSTATPHSKSRRKGRGRHKNQKHQHQHLNHQFSSSSL